MGLLTTIKDYFKNKSNIEKAKADIRTALISSFKTIKIGTGTILVKLGSTTTDDEAITALLTTAILAGEKSYIGSTPISEDMIKTALTEAFLVLDAGEIKLGTKLKS